MDISFLRRNQELIQQIFADMPKYDLDKLRALDRARALAQATSKKDSTPSHILPLSDCLQTPQQVKVFVGKERKLWVLNEALLCNRVSFFRAAFQGGFKEGKKKTIHLVEDDPTDFKTLVDWLYIGQLCCDDCRSMHRKSMDRDAGYLKDLSHFTRIYLFAEKLCCEDLITDLASHAKQMSTVVYADGSPLPQFISPELLHRVYKETAVGSKLRTTITEFVCRTFFTFPIDKQYEITRHALESNCKEFTEEYLKAIDEHILIPHHQCRWWLCKTHHVLRKAQLSGQNQQS